MSSDAGMKSSLGFYSGFTKKAAHTEQEMLQLRNAD